ncbi:MAG: hypothetical protein H0U57_13615 [Tatlockia sp.]|nr:hypothetical protein [Tatlockia sp.]
MKYLGKIITISLISASAHAGFYGFTMHSRANCNRFNESVSWEFNNPHDLQTFSQHESPNFNWRCDLVSGWNKTWRSAVYHFAEGYSSRDDNWHVEGQHWGVKSLG